MHNRLTIYKAVWIYGWLLASLGAALGVDTVRAADAPAQRPPNIVFIMADDMGWGDLSCYGASGINTPNCDRLAEEGMRFTDAHTPAALCSPTRYSVLTGRYPWRVKHIHPVCGVDDPLSIDPKEPTVASLLKQAGYATCCIGKWHLGLGSAKRVDWNKPLRPGPNQIGFDYFFGVPTGHWAEPFVWVENDHVVGMTEEDQIIRFGRETWVNTVETVRPHHTFGPELTRRAVRFIEDHQNQPFFLYFPTCAVHSPIEPAPFMQGTSKIGPYGDFVQQFDWTVGEVMKTLDRLDLTDNTLIMVTSDNGGVDWFAERTHMGHDPSGGFKGYKSHAWEGGHRVPFIARWPGRVPAGTTSDEVIVLTDLTATACAINDIDLPTKAAPDSYNILPALLDPDLDKPVREATVVCSNSAKLLAIRKGRWKLINGLGSGGAGPAVKPSGKPGEPLGQLYDMIQDPRETRNVYNQHPEVVAELTALLKTYRKQGYSSPMN